MLAHSQGTPSPRVCSLCSSRSDAVSILEAWSLSNTTSSPTVLRPVPSYLWRQGQNEGKPFHGQSGRKSTFFTVLAPHPHPSLGTTQHPGYCAQVKASPALAWRPRAAQGGHVQNTKLEGRSLTHLLLLTCALTCTLQISSLHHPPLFQSLLTCLCIHIAKTHLTVLCSPPTQHPLQAEI